MTLNGAIKQLHELRCNEDMPTYLKPAIAEVINVLLMDAKEARRGRWVDHSDEYDDDYYECSVCGEPWVFIGGTPKDNGAHYCPNCGASMMDDNAIQQTECVKNALDALDEVTK